MTATTVPSECATTHARVGTETLGHPGDAAVLHVGLRGEHTGEVLDAIEHALADGVGERGQHVGAAGQVLGEVELARLLRGLHGFGRHRLGIGAEVVAVERDGDVALRDLHAVVPQPVTQRRDPSGRDLVRSPELVERAVHEDDLRHGRTLSTHLPVGP